MINILKEIAHQVKKIIIHTDDICLFGEAKDNTMTKALLQCQLGALETYIQDKIRNTTWKQPSIEVPKDGEKVLVCYNGIYGLLIWNEHCNCWDDSEGDDYFCDKEQISHWMSLPEMPKV